MQLALAPTAIAAIALRGVEPVAPLLHRGVTPGPHPGRIEPEQVGRVPDVMMMVYFMSL